MNNYLLFSILQYRKNYKQISYYTIMFVLKRKFKGEAGVRTYHYIAETFYVNGKPRHRILKYLGTAENIFKKFKLNKG